MAELHFDKDEHNRQYTHAQARIKCPAGAHADWEALKIPAKKEKEYKPNQTESLRRPHDVTEREPQGERSSQHPPHQQQALVLRPPQFRDDYRKEWR